MQNRRKQIEILVFLIILILGAIIIKAGTWRNMQDRSPFMANDSLSYHNSAKALLYTGSFSLSLEKGDIPQVIRTPGYPLFLAAVYAFGGSNPAAAIFAQLVASALTAFLVYLLGRLLFGEAAVALMAVVIYLTDLVSLGNSFLLLTETLFTFFLTLIIYYCVKLAGAKNSPKILLYSGLISLLLAIATLIRPLTYYLPIPLLIFIIVLAISHHWDRKLILAAMGLFIIPFVFIVGGWQVRNYRLTGNADLSHIEGVNMLFYRAAGIVSLRDNISMDEARQQLAGGEKNALVSLIVNDPANGLAQKWKE